MKRYDITAKIYDERYFEEQNRKYQRALKDVNIEGLVVLDMGCGSGLFFSYPAKQAEIVVGIDVSHELLLRAKKQNKQFKNVFLVQADADHLPFRDCCFGAGFAFTVLQNIPNPAIAMAELRRTVKTNNKIVVTGLKKAFAINKFIDILEQTTMQIISFIDEENLNCYIAVLTA
jgi:ubiquinone/menaquinone biosynthesis C-methylase UbiE